MYSCCLGSSRISENRRGISVLSYSGTIRLEQRDPKGREGLLQLELRQGEL